MSNKEKSDFERIKESVDGAIKEFKDAVENGKELEFDTVDAEYNPLSIGVSDFVERQTKDSQYTNYILSYNRLRDITKKEFVKGNFSEGYRDGVVLVRMPDYEVPYFYTYDGYPMFEGMKLTAEYKRIKGREHENPKVVVEIKEPKIPCKYVDIVLYRADVLEEDNDRSTACDWEIVSINGRLKEEPTPMDPLTIVRNWKHLKGGTEMKGKTAEEVLEMLCQSIMHKNGLKNG